MPQTLIEKIVNRYAVDLPANKEVHAGDYVAIRPKHVMTHDNTGAVIPKFRTIGAPRVHNPRQPVFCLDHDIQNTSPENLAKYAKIEAFAREHGIDFHRAGSGIGHQIMVEEGYVTPGSLVVASDSHSNLYGGAATLGTPVVRTDAAVLWATGQTWWEIPPVARVELRGRLQPGVTGKDVIITLCGVFNKDDVLNHVVEFVGDGVAALSMDQRFTIANMTTEWGALAGVFPFDDVLRDYLFDRAALFACRGDDPVRFDREDVEQWYEDCLVADPDAWYAKTLVLDLNEVTPHVAGPNEVKTITPLPEIALKKQRVDKAYLLSCVNGRLEDIEQAAAVMAGKKIAPHVKFYVAAASESIQKTAEEKGWWRQLTDAGAITLSPGCGPCIGLGEGTLEAGEVGISATNRNFQGRMGSRDASVYLASPPVVAASALAGYITAPTEFPTSSVHAEVRLATRPDAEAAGETEILPGFPAECTGRLLYLPKDNLNTDGIYGKDVTYRDDLTPEEMGAAAMRNYDPSFQEIARKGDIIVGGRNFGSGSSREQAATALAYRGIQMVIAASFSQTYKRNAFNNGFVVFECPELVDHLAVAHAADVKNGVRTIPAAEAHIDFRRSRITCGQKTFPFYPLGEVPQSLIIAGGAEALTAKQLATAPSA